MPAATYITCYGIGSCPSHSGSVNYTTVFSSNPIDTVTTNTQGKCVVGTIGISTCGHPTIAMTGSGTVTAGTKPVHRIGDMGENAGPYTVTTGSGDVNVGD